MTKVNEITKSKSKSKIYDEKITLANMPDDAEAVLGELNASLEKFGITGLEECAKGGFSRVYKCSFADKESVIKLSSYKKLANIDNDYFFTSEDKPNVNRQFALEAYSYTSLSDKRKKDLAKAFMVAVFVGKKIYDYIFCVNIPCYVSLSEALGNNYDEKAVLEMAEDVLVQLEDAHSEGYRHRDIKIENIMYDAEEEKYVLIDWGAACIASEKLFYELKKGGAYTDVYVDPLRFKDGHESDKGIDLFSLGVVMIFLMHKDGYRKDNDILKFHEKVCPDAKENFEDTDIRYFDCSNDELKNGMSEAFFEIVQKAMNHSYERTSDMRNAVRALLPDRAKKVEEKGIKLNLNSWWGLIFAAAMGGWSFIGGFGGFCSVFKGEANLSLTYLVLAYCALLPFIVIGIESKGSRWKKEVRIKNWWTVLTPIMIFAFMSAFTAGLLKLVQIPYPIFLMSLQLVLAVAIYIVITKATGFKEIWFALTGFIGGAISGYFVALCIMEKNVFWNEGTMEIVLISGIIGCVVSLICGYAGFLRRTALKKRNEI